MFRRLIMREEVIFKGVRGNVQLLFPEAVDFAIILAQIKAKLAAAADFFSVGSIIQVPQTRGTLTSEQQEQLTVTLAHYGLQWEPIDNTEQAALPELVMLTPESEGREIQALVIAKTLRGGQKIVYEQSVVVIGDVNPGAEVVAGGDIIVLGTCRGIAHAGAYGNRQATITAGRLVANQLRIAGVIARSPDNPKSPEYAETARIIEGAVLIQPASK